MIDIEIGRAIKLIREAKDLKLSKLASATESSIPYLSMVESGRKAPSLSMVQKIAEALDIPVDALIIISKPKNSTLESSDSRTDKLTRAISKLAKAEKMFRMELNKTDET